MRCSTPSPASPGPAARGCALPIQKARLEAGETVLDLGCGEGSDALEAAAQVGAEGFVYGLDMSGEALDAARWHALQAGIENIRFLKGFIEDIPLGSATVDVVVSNCVINLSSDRAVALAEAHRVLRPGGRMVVADVVLLDPAVPAETQRLVAPLFGCDNGVLAQECYPRLLEACGFEAVEVELYQRFTLDRIRSRAERRSHAEVLDALEDPHFSRSVHGAFASVHVLARKGG